jgi:hypothetical protein
MRRRDVLEHHDGIVDDQADREHQREQGEQVHREAERISQRVKVAINGTLGTVTAGN